MLWCGALLANEAPVQSNVTYVRQMNYLLRTMIDTGEFARPTISDLYPIAWTCARTSAVGLGTSLL